MISIYDLVGKLRVLVFGGERKEIRKEGVINKVFCELWKVDMELVFFFIFFVK